MLVGQEVYIGTLKPVVIIAGINGWHSLFADSAVAAPYCPFPQTNSAAVLMRAP